jgi:hypothetical protein
MEQELARRWFFRCLGILAAAFIAVALLVVIVDPYFHYHKPLPFLSYRLYEERYINDGISRHFDFDAIITGTSMAQNFKPSEMDALFGTRSVKETFSGAGYQELSENLERALKRNPDITTVVWTVDYNGFLRDYDWVQYEDYPTYLYDDTPWNDVSYLFNKDVLYHALLPCLAMTLTGQPSTTMDEYSAWERETGLSVILQSYDRENVSPEPKLSFDEEDRRAVTQTIEQNITRVVNQYPDVTFYIFYPPYSICYWDALHIKGTLERQIMAEQTATGLLLQCPNVRLFNFFDQYQVVCNPDYYCDDGHYSGEVNSMILRWMAEGCGLVTKENYLEKIQTELDFYLGFDYDSIYEGN